MTDEEFKRLLRLQNIFMPYVTKQQNEARTRQGVGPEDGLRFAHYTSADSALKILQSKRLWLRNTTCMSDYSEVSLGFDMLRKYFDPKRTQDFADALDLSAPGVAMGANNNFNGWWNNRQQLNIYISSLSEHDPKEEDTHGRLSMWRAFGNNSPTRVALIFKVQIPSRSEAVQALRILFSPVAYLKEAEVHQHIRDVAAKVAQEAAFLKTFDKNIIGNFLFLMLFAGVTCLKHEGFREEREWRVVYNDAVFPSPLMVPSLEVIGGVPQHIYKLPLDETVSPQLTDLDICRLVDRVIIGPSPYPWVLYRAFVEALKSARVPDAEHRVCVSNIPIRQ